MVARFANREIAHETNQIAMDGTEKLPQRIFAPACDLPPGSTRLGTFALCFAAWLAVMHHRINADKINEIAQQLNDPRADEIISALGDHQDPAVIYEKLAHLPGWMPQQLQDDGVWRSAVIARLSLLMSDGADVAIKRELAI
ncbi:MAG: hypothetical protein CMO05_04495 [Thalassospira sp.]|nr:hypothetical protein [Thalassospira sp.]